MHCNGKCSLTVLQIAFVAVFNLLSDGLASHAQLPIGPLHQIPYVDWEDFRNEIYKSWQHGFTDGMTLNQLLYKTPDAEQYFQGLFRRVSSNVTEFWKALFDAQKSGELDYSSEKIAVSYAFFICELYTGTPEFCPRPCRRAPCQAHTCFQTEAGLFHNNYQCDCRANYYWDPGIQQCMFCAFPATWSITLKRCITTADDKDSLTHDDNHLMGYENVPSAIDMLPKSPTEESTKQEPLQQTKHVHWLNWESWDECDNQCGVGLRKRRRYCLNTDQPELCMEPDTNSESCFGASILCANRASSYIIIASLSLCLLGAIIYAMYSRQRHIRAEQKVLKLNESSMRPTRTGQSMNIGEGYTAFADDTKTTGNVAVPTAVAAKTDAMRYNHPKRMHNRLDTKRQTQKRGWRQTDIERQLMKRTAQDTYQEFSGKDKTSRKYTNASKRRKQPSSDDEESSTSSSSHYGSLTNRKPSSRTNKTENRQDKMKPGSFDHSVSMKESNKRIPSDVPTSRRRSNQDRMTIGSFDRKIRVKEAHASQRGGNQDRMTIGTLDRKITVKEAQARKPGDSATGRKKSRRSKMITESLDHRKSVKDNQSRTSNATSRNVVTKMSMKPPTYDSMVNAMFPSQTGYYGDQIYRPDIPQHYAPRYHDTTACMPFATMYTPPGYMVRPEHAHIPAPLATVYVPANVSTAVSPTTCVRRQFPTTVCQPTAQVVTATSPVAHNQMITSKPATGAHSITRQAVYSASLPNPTGHQTKIVHVQKQQATLYKSPVTNANIVTTLPLQAQRTTLVISPKPNCATGYYQTVHVPCPEPNTAATTSVQPPDDKPTATNMDDTDDAVQNGVALSEHYTEDYVTQSNNDQQQPVSGGFLTINPCQKRCACPNCMLPLADDCVGRTTRATITDVIGSLRTSPLPCNDEPLIVLDGTLCRSPCCNEHHVHADLTSPYADPIRVYDGRCQPRPLDPNRYAIFTAPDTHRTVQVNPSATPPPPPIPTSPEYAEVNSNHRMYEFTRNKSNEFCPVFKILYIPKQNREHMAKMKH